MEFIIDVWSKSPIYIKDLLIGTFWVSVVFLIWWIITTLAILLVMAINKVTKLIWIGLEQIGMPVYGRYPLVGTVLLGFAFATWRLIVIVTVILLVPIARWLISVTSG